MVKDCLGFNYCFTTFLCTHCQSATQNDLVDTQIFLLGFTQHFNNNS